MIEPSSFRKEKRGSFGAWFAIYAHLCNKLIGFERSDMSKSAELKENVMPSSDVSAFELARVMETESMGGRSTGSDCDVYSCVGDMGEPNSFP